VAVAGIATTVYLQVVRENNPTVVRLEPVHVDPITDLPLPADAPPPLLDELPAQGEPQTDLPALDESDGDMLGWLPHYSAKVFCNEKYPDLAPPRLLSGSSRIRRDSDRCNPP
jgi:hypothetical protein